jgi:monoamine oxidase
MREIECDVIVIGAGAAGLAAADELARAGCATLVLEARERIGGRCWSLRIAGLPVPVELGAEFIHGRAGATASLIQACGSAAVDAPRRPWIVKSGRLEPRADYPGEIHAAMKRDRSLARRDMTFEAYLERVLRPSVSSEACVYARMLVQGYDAADPARVSARTIVEEWTQEGATALARPRSGYGPLLEYLYARAAANKARFALQTVARRLTWRREYVTVNAERAGGGLRATAKRALVTLPVGVLQDGARQPGALTFSPELKGKRAALRALGAGPVIKVVLHFSSAFWEESDGGRYRDGTFFHCPGAAFPTFWTALPVRAPLLVAWAGGPNAERLRGASRVQILESAMNSLRDILGEPAPGHLVGAHLHHWQQDPYARGAYSYVMAGGARAREALAEPVAGTLYFAGEAADLEGEAGTVAGALQSGRRAALQIIRGL